jgi:iron complex transport system substrate-binding protein
MRIASLLPSATEIICALGSRAELVGRSHECDFPAGVQDVLVLTSARIEPLARSRAIDRAVRDLLRDALAIYQVDVERLRDARPDVIVTQDLCNVCAVSLDDVRAAVARLAQQDVAIVNLHPTQLDDIWHDVLRVAGAIGCAEIGRQVVAGLRARIADIACRAAALRRKPRVLTIEWIDPVMIGGMWMPELVTLAGGEPLVTRSGEHAPTLPRDRLSALEPDVVVVKPCGFGLRRTLTGASDWATRWASASTLRMALLRATSSLSGRSLRLAGIQNGSIARSKMETSGLPRRRMRAAFPRRR